MTGRLGERQVCIDHFQLVEQVLIVVLQHMHGHGSDAALVVERLDLAHDAHILVRFNVFHRRAFVHRVVNPLAHVHLTRPIVDGILHVGGVLRSTSHPRNDRYLTQLRAIECEWCI